MSGLDGPPDHVIPHASNRIRRGHRPHPDAVLSSTLSPSAVIRPRDGMFAARAQRLRFLAPDHELAPWLQATAALCDLQQTLLDHACPVWQPDRPTFDDGHPVLAPDRSGWAAPLVPLHRALLAAAAGALPQAGVDSDTLIAELRAAQATSDLSLLEQAQDLLHLCAGTPMPRPRRAEDLWLAASLQVLWTQAARHLAPLPGRPSDRAACPCCGSLPVAGIVLSGDGKAGSRYLECSLCATRWNAERARCVLCDSDHGVEYLGLEGLPSAVQAEVCDGCGGSVKTMFQDKDAGVDPLADDLASLRLDVAVGHEGYGRAAVNLFLLEAAPAQE